MAGFHSVAGVRSTFASAAVLPRSTAALPHSSSFPGSSGGTRPRITRTWGVARLRGLASERVDRQKVAVVGAGAVGLYYGARLLEAGHDVSFIARTELDYLQRHGLTVESVDGNMRFDSIKVFGTAEEIGKVDWVVMALKTYALSAAPDLIRPLVGANTNILPIMNGFGIEDTLAKSFDSAFIFGGMAFVCINRVDGICKHLKYGALQVGHAHDEPGKLALVEELFAGTNVKLTTVPCLRMARWETLKLKYMSSPMLALIKPQPLLLTKPMTRWEKLCWNIPFNGLAVGMGGITTDKICSDADLRALARDLMNEVISASHLDAQDRYS